jgi:hypothetical protein
LTPRPNDERRGADHIDASSPPGAAGIAARERTRQVDEALLKLAARSVHKALTKHRRPVNAFKTASKKPARCSGLIGSAAAMMMSRSVAVKPRGWGICDCPIACVKGASAISLLQLPFENFGLHKLRADFLSKPRRQSVAFGVRADALRPRQSPLSDAARTWKA